MIVFTDFPGELIGNENVIRGWLEDVCGRHNRKLGKLIYNFIDNERILEINRHYLHHDYYTDIITFDYSNGREISGEVYISVERVEEQAGELGEDIDRELKRVVVHGLLHLLGFNDGTKKEKEIMRREEEKALILQAQKFED